MSKALLDGKVTLSSFDESARAEVASLCSKVSVSSQNPYRQSYPDSWGSGVKVKTSDGEEIVASRTDCKGDPELPLTRAEMIEKATSLLIFGGFAEAEALALCDQVMQMPSGGGSTAFMHDFIERALS